MARTVVWNNNTPVNGVDPNNTEDDIVRSIRAGIHERMADIVTDWLADPVVLPQFVDALRFVKRYKFDADAAVGSRALNPLNVPAMLTIDYQGNTDASSNIVVSFNEFAEIYNLNDLVFSSLVGTEIVPVNQAMFQQSTGDAVFPYPVNVNIGARTITYNIRRSDGGQIGSGQFITGNLIFFFSNIPT